MDREANDYSSIEIPPQIHQAVTRGLEAAFTDADQELLEETKAEVAIETLDTLRASGDLETYGEELLQQEVQAAATEILNERRGLPSDIQSCIRRWVAPPQRDLALRQVQRNRPWAVQSIRDFAAIPFRIETVMITDAYLEYTFAPDQISTNEPASLDCCTVYDLRWATTPANDPLGYEFEYEFHIEDTEQNNIIYVSVASGQIIHLSNTPFPTAERRMQSSGAPQLEETILGVHIRSTVKSLTEQVLEDLPPRRN